MYDVIMKYDELVTHEELVLLKTYEWQYITSSDAQTVLSNCSMSYASKVLGSLWRKGYLSRRRIKKKRGGKKYKYWLSTKGEKIVKWLQEKHEKLE